MSNIRKKLEQIQRTVHYIEAILKDLQDYLRDIECLSAEIIKEIESGTEKITPISKLS